MRMIPALMAMSLATGVLTLPVAAQDSVLACRITKSNGVIQDEMLFGIDTAQGVVMVVDPLIMYFNDSGAITARITERTAKKTVFRWELLMTDVSGNPAIMRFRAALQRPSMRLLVSAQPSAYDSIFTARGRCVETTASALGG